MDVIPFCANSQKPYFKPLGNFYANVLQDRIYFIGDYQTWNYSIISTIQPTQSESRPLFLIIILPEPRTLTSFIPFFSLWIEEPKNVDEVGQIGKTALTGC
ncbi:hypothetical protein [Desulfosarcina alkanivorans]|uniref:hypothetical protein n=1 Tax=Desulfosarcina alkanivorans TaxID=571177 RepID=UPI001E36D7B9|nr:hypothetical protein [Desulfosarcina alkanivorans]